MGALPIWYSMGDAGQFNQFMYVDTGSELSYDFPNTDLWMSEGYDTEKHMFVDSDGLFWKIRNRGEDNTWAFSADC